MQTLHDTSNALVTQPNDLSENGTVQERKINDIAVTGDTINHRWFHALLTDRIILVFPTR